MCPLSKAVTLSFLAQEDRHIRFIQIDMQRGADKPCVPSRPKVRHSIIIKVSITATDTFHSTKGTLEPKTF